MILSSKFIVESFQRFKGANVLSQVEGMFGKLDKVVKQQFKTMKTTSYSVVDFEKMPVPGHYQTTAIIHYL